MKFNTTEDYVRALEKERDDFIDQNPHLKEFQETIDKELMGLNNPLLRAAKMHELLVKKMTTELLPAQRELRKIQVVVNNMANEMKEQKEQVQIDISFELENMQ